MRPTTYLSLHPGEDGIASLDLLGGGRLDGLTHAAVGDLRWDEGRGAERQGKDGCGSGQSSRDHGSCCSFELTFKSERNAEAVRSVYRIVSSSSASPPQATTADVACFFRWLY